MVNNLRTNPQLYSTNQYNLQSTVKRDEYKTVMKKCVSQCATVNNNERIKREPGEVNFCGFSATGAERFYRSKALHKILEFADKQQLVFSAAFALILTGLFRPAAIMSLPGKKNKDDKKYAAAQSIASGVIGFVTSSLLFIPLSMGAKKFKNNAKDFIKDPNSYLYKEEIVKNKLIQKNLNAAGTYIDRCPDVIFAIPKGLLTVALIPPILKHVFGWEKKKVEEKTEQQPMPDPSLLHFKENVKGGLR